MGMPFLSRSSHEDGPPQPAGNPDPRKFEIRRSHSERVYAAIEVVFHGVTNYEGRKVIVMRRADLAQALAVGILDPHFSDKGPSPVARFEPTEFGWKLATSLVVSLEHMLRAYACGYEGGSDGNG